MSKLFLALGAAAFALGPPASAEKGGNQGKGGGNGGPAMKADRGNGGGDKGRGAGREQARIDRGSQRAQGPDRDDRNVGRAGQGGFDHGNGRTRDDDVRTAKRENNQGNHRVDRDENTRVMQPRFGPEFANGRGINNCPPGLDRKDNGCLPPGQAIKFLGARIQSNFADNLVPYQYRNWYRDDYDHFYRAGDGFIYRVSRNNNLVDGIIPLFGGGNYYSIGDQWPDPYDFYNVPQQYRTYYADGGDYRYRYGDGAIYRVDRSSGAIAGIVALLAGDLGVGGRLPDGYDTYNVPLAYRDRYADSAENWYRYNDGYIYQVDPRTRLISAVIDAIV